MDNTEKKNLVNNTMQEFSEMLKKIRKICDVKITDENLKMHLKFIMKIEKKKKIYKTCF